jgi:hypothetical protein
MSRAAALLVIVLATAACAEPPSKEMNQAQGAIDNARAAGAEQFAAAQFKNAVDALRRADEAVAQRDYRLALAQAIDSREYALAATKAATEARARTRGNIERTIAEATALLTQLRRRLEGADAARLPRRVTDAARQTADRSDKSLQEARAALAADDYPAAIKASDGVVAQLQAGLRTVEETDNGASGKRRR